MQAQAVRVVRRSCDMVRANEREAELVFYGPRRSVDAEIFSTIELLHEEVGKAKMMGNGFFSGDYWRLVTRRISVGMNVNVGSRNDVALAIDYP